MKFRDRKSLCVLLMIAFGASAFAQVKPFALHASLQADSNKKSVKCREAVLWNKDSVIINYHSPAVRSRTIWGGLVPYGNVWVTGGHMATNIELPHAVIMNGQKILKGKYALFTIPKANDEWVVILNKNWQQHLTDEYDEKDDVIRIPVSSNIESPHAERLQWGFVPTDAKNAWLYMRWEKVQIAVPVSR